MIEGKPIEMLPGTCSNPEPPASITELPLGPLDLAWYMLAEAEISSQCDVGILKSLRSKLTDGPVLFMEVTVRNRRITTDVLATDSAGFVQHFMDYLAAMEYLRTQDQAVRDTFNPLNLPRGEIQPLSPEDWTQPHVEGVAADAIIAFGLVASLRGTANPAIELRKKLRETFGDSYAGKNIVDKLCGNDAPLAPLDAEVTDAVAFIRSGVHLTPQKVWEIGLRLFEKIRQSGFRNVLAPLLASWLKASWSRIVTNETFRLSRPMQTVPAIEACLTENRKTEASIALLLLRSAEAVGSPLSGTYEKLLREISVGGR